MDGVTQYGAFAVAAVLGVAGFALGDYALLAWCAAAVVACAGVIALSPRWGITATSVLGLAASGYLFRQKVDPHPSICNIDAKINCDVVNGSDASMLFGIPIALLGSAFFVGVAAASMMPPGRQTRLYQPTAAFGAVGVAYSVWLAYQAWLLGAVCVFCMTIYACNALLVVAGWRGIREEAKGLTDGLDEVLRSSAWLVMVGLLLVVTLLGQSWYAGHKPADAGALLAAKPGENPAPQPDETANAYVARPGGVPLEGDEPVLGNRAARYTIVEFADFMCPHCAQAFPYMHQLVEQNPNVQVHFRTFALTGECNPATGPGNHPDRCRAAMAAQCAHEQGKFWEIAGLLFANQRMIAEGGVEELISGIAQHEKLDLQKFSTCMQSEATLAQVQRDGVAGGELDIYGTPSFFVKGVFPDGRWLESCEGPIGVIRAIQAAEAGGAPEPARRECPRE